MRKILYESPIDDYITDDQTKSSIIKANQKKYENAKSELRGSNLGDLMNNLPYLEREYRDELTELGISIFFENYPRIKQRINEGILTLDAKITENVGGRKVDQNVSKNDIEQAIQKDPLFQERLQARQLQNAKTQGNAWVQGFNSFKKIEDELNELNPQLAKKYEQFEKAATIFYHENTRMLENMASTSSGRYAYADVREDPNKPGSYIIEVRAPNFPLFMHELFKGGDHYLTYIYLPSDKFVSNTLTQTSDVHKHEIKNMITGREVANKLSYFWKENPNYKPWMDNDIKMYFNWYANENPVHYNKIMYKGVLLEPPTDEEIRNEKNPQLKIEKQKIKQEKEQNMKEFDTVLTQIISQIIKNNEKNPLKTETPNYKEIISRKRKEPERIEPEDEDEDEPEYIEPEDEDVDDSWWDDVPEDED